MAASSKANVFIIAEHDIKDAREIVLRGRTLPYQGVGWGTTQRVDINYFPGNPVAIAQVIGATWNDTTCTGRWSDLFLRNDEHAPDLINFATLAETALPDVDAAVANRLPTTGLQDLPDNTTSTTFQSGGALPPRKARTAGAIRDAIYALCRGGQLLRVEWGAIVRYGYIGEFTPTHDREQDIDWEIMFKWIGKEPTQPQPQPESKDLVSAIEFVQSRVLTIIEFLSSGDRPSQIEVFDRLPSSSLNAHAIFIEQYRRQFIQYVRKINSSSKDLFSALERIVRAITPIDPRELFGNVRGAMDGLVQATNEMLDAFETLGAAVGTARTTHGSPADVTVVDGLQRAFRKLALELAAEARRQQAEIDRFLTPRIKTIVRPYAGTTLRDISIQEYGTANNWRAIQDFNGLPDSVVPAGTVIRVPEITSGQTARERRISGANPTSLNVSGVL